MKTTASIASKKRVVAKPKKHDPIGNAHDPKYMDFLSRFESAFFFEAKKGRLFTTDVPGKLLWRSYLRGFPTGKRQHYKCNACRHFVERFGGLVTIDAEGKKFPALWSVAADPAYEKSFAAMSDLVSASRVTGVFFSDLSDLGSRETGPWRHLAVVNPMVFHVTKLKDAHQATAEKLEEFKIVQNALAEFSLPLIRKACDMASSGMLARTEKINGPLQWLRDLKDRTIGILSMRDGENIIWRAVADAPAGYCHVRSSVVGALLTDLQTLHPQAVATNHAKRMDPLQYQRPQAPPKAGNIDRAEKVIAELHAAGSLSRRYAMLREIEKIWVPSAVNPVANVWDGLGVFSHLKPAEKFNGLITFERFRREVLPQAKRIQLRVPHTGNFCGLVTSTYMDAPPILRWDGALDRPRNPFSWYLYHGGSPATNWGFQAGTMVDVTAVTLRPHMWHGIEFPGEGKGAVFVLRGAHDSRAAHCGNALFPETLRPELREIRATIEAYSKGQRLGGAMQASANGLAMVNGPLGAEVIVTSASGLLTSWTIDRWD